MDLDKALIKKRVALFVVLAVVIAWSIFLLIPLTGQAYGTGISVIILAAGMFAPALGSILTRLITREGFKSLYLRPRFKGHIRAYLLVFFGPSVLLLAGAAVYFLIFPGSFDPTFPLLEEAAAAGRTGGLSTKTLLLITVLQVVVIGPVINIIPTLGEELGWRGYLLPKLRLLMSDRTAMVVTGVVWGLWHLPVIVMGHNYGTDYPGYPWLGILTMTVFCVVLGVVEGYAAIRLQSAIPAAMIHSTVNAGAALPLYMISGSYNPILGPTIAGYIGGLPFIAAAAVLFIKAGKMAVPDADGDRRADTV